MPVYTVAAACTPLLVDRENRLFDFTVAVFRDGIEINQFVQKYGEAVSDAEVREDMEQKINRIINADYDDLARADLDTRCRALDAVLSEFTRTLP